jgi:hypothetical protein
MKIVGKLINPIFLVFIAVAGTIILSSSIASAGQTRQTFLPSSLTGYCNLQPDGTCPGILLDGGGCHHDAVLDFNTKDERGNPQTQSLKIKYGLSKEFPKECPGDADWPSYPYYGLTCLSPVPNHQGLYNSFHVPDCEVDSNVAQMLITVDKRNSRLMHISQHGLHTQIHPNLCLQGEIQPTKCYPTASMGDARGSASGGGNSGGVGSSGDSAASGD